MRKLLSILLIVCLCAASGCQCFQCEETKSEPAPAPTPAPAPKPAPAPAAAYYTATQLYNNDCCGTLKLEKILPQTVTMNAPFEYTIKATNLTDKTLSSVVITERLPQNFKYISSSPEGKLAGQILTWQLDSMGPNEAKTMVVKGQATSEGWLATCADATYIIPACAKTQVVQPALELVKNAPAEVSICDPMQVTFTITNKGTGEARNIQITDPLPAGLTTMDGSSQVTMKVDSLPAGRSATKTVQIKATKTGTYENRAVAVADGNLKSESNVTRTKVTQPVLTIDKTIGREWEYGGRRVEYTITVANKGDGVARNTVVTDMIPTGVEQLQVSGGGTQSGGLITWNVGDLAPGASKQFTVSYVPTALGKISNTATAKAVCAQDVSKSASVEIRGIPALLLEVVDVADPIEVGQNETYVITVTNQGTATATNLKIVCMLEDTMQFVSADGATKGSAEGNKVTFAPLASLNAKAKASWKVTVKAAKEGDVRFGVVLNADQLDRDVQETESTHFYK
ncbi:MAG TPA: CARDB domain-containing protein [Anaerohalosphaeraceae bacterium]|nr:CARDB domain-containing protein [Anaerohalosphaeraceae bacterium]